MGGMPPVTLMTASSMMVLTIQACSTKASAIQIGAITTSGAGTAADSDLVRRSLDALGASILGESTLRTRADSEVTGEADRLDTSESVRKVYQGLQSLPSTRYEADRRQTKKCERVRVKFSKSLDSRRQRPNHANVSPTTQRQGRTLNPRSDRFTISISSSGVSGFTALRNFGP
jgi:hypothetical protein